MKYKVQASNERQLEVILAELFKLGYRGTRSKTLEEMTKNHKGFHIHPTVIFDTDRIDSIYGISENFDHTKEGIAVYDYARIYFEEIFTKKVHLNIDESEGQITIPVKMTYNKELKIIRYFININKLNKQFSKSSGCKVTFFII